MDVVVAEAGVDEVELLEPLWRSMVEHHRALVGREWPVRDAGEAWALRRIQYLEWLRDGTATLFTAAVGPSTDARGLRDAAGRPGGAHLGARHGDRRGGVACRARVRARRRRGLRPALGVPGALRERGVEYWSVAVVEANSRRDAAL